MFMILPQHSKKPFTSQKLALCLINFLTAGNFCVSDLQSKPHISASGNVPLFHAGLKGKGQAQNLYAA